eukprot:Rhum_TRINITY_DN12354_c1_g1::Rhum_TRINITY_DN12354_c1_g1_i1::g.51357::m.51357/K20279/SYNJ; synaptojanin
MPFFKRRPSVGADSPGSPTGKSVSFAASDNGSFSQSPLDKERSERDAAASARVQQAIRDKERLKLLQRHLLQIPKNLYLKRQDLSVAVCTWNVAEAEANRVSGLENWLQARRGADIIAIGLQEVDMGAVNLATSSKGKSDPWLDCLNRHVIPYNFRKLASASLVGTLIVVFVKSSVAPHVEHLSVKDVKLGTGGFIGNKGALAISFVLSCKRFVFITSHFVPHTENTSKRNENFHFVLNSLTQQHTGPKGNTNEVCCDLVAFGKSGEAGTRVSASGVDKGMFGSPKAGQQATVSNSILGSSDYVFWFGDLNYRVETDYEEIMQYIAHRRIDKILLADQLTKEMGAGRVFSDFKEPPITFLPTYKFLKGENIYDTSKKGGKPRVPAYTDRVLAYRLQTPKPDDFLPVNSNVLTAMKYKSYVNVVSDHHPVCCLYHTATYAADPQALDRIIDLGGTGMSPAQIETALTDFTGRTPDEASLYRGIPVPVDTVNGPGTCYSSDEDEETVEQKMSTKLEDRLASLETLLKAGPSSSDDTLGDIKTGQRGLQSKVEDLAARMMDMPIVPNDEINLLGESMTHVLDRLQSVESMLSAEPRGDGGDSSASVAAVRGQFDDLTKRMDIFASALSNASAGGGIGDNMPEAYRDYGALPYEEREVRSRLRDAFMAGATLGSRYAASRASGDSNAAAQIALEEERERFFRRREDDLSTMLKQREGECERRERAVAVREDELESRAETLAKLQKVLDEKVEAAAALQVADSTSQSVLRRREEESKDAELRLLQERARLSSQQLKLKQEMADLEETKEAFSSRLHHREQVLSHREGHLDAVETRYQQAYDAHPSPAARSVTPPQRRPQPFKGVLEGPSESPGRVRGTVHERGRRSQSPLSDLLSLHNLLPEAAAGATTVSPPREYSARRSASPSVSPPLHAGAGSAPYHGSPAVHHAHAHGHAHAHPSHHSSHGHAAHHSDPMKPQARRTTKPRAAPADRLAVGLQPWLHNASLPSNFARVGSDPRNPDGGYVYAFGTRKVSIKMVGPERMKEPHVLIGSGWMPFKDFITKFGDSEQRRLEKSRQY